MKKRIIIVAGFLVLSAGILQAFSFKDIGKGIEKGAHEVEKGVKKGAHEVEKGGKTAVGAITNINPAAEANKLTNKALGTLGINLPGIEKDIVIIEQNIDRLINDVGALKKTVNPTIDQAKNIVRDLGNFQKEAKKVVGEVKADVKKIAGAITDPSKIPGLALEAGKEGLTGIKALADIHATLLKDIDGLELKATLDLASRLTQEVSSLLNAIEGLEKNTGRLGSLVIPNNLKTALSQAKQHINNLALHTGKIYQPIGLSAQEMELQVAMGLLSNLSGIVSLKDDITKTVSVTKEQIGIITKTLPLLKQQIGALKKYAKDLPKTVANGLLDRFKSNPPAIIVAGPSYAVTSVQAAIKTFNTYINNIMRDGNKLLLALSTIISTGAAAADTFNKTLKDHAILPQQSLDALKDVGVDTKDLSQDVVNLGRAL